MNRRFDLEAWLEAVAEAAAGEHGLALVDVSTRRHRGTVQIVVAVDKAGGVTIDECQKVSRVIGAEIDREGILADYTLEVQSPGLDRRLRSDREFRYFTGREIEASTLVPIEGRRRFTGILKGIVDGSIVITGDDGQDVHIPRQQLASARLVVKF